MNSLPDIVNALVGRGFCDHCLGRQLGKLYSGTTNDERGKALRLYSRMETDLKKIITSPEHENHGEATIEEGTTKDPDTMRSTSTETSAEENGVEKGDGKEKVRQNKSIKVEQNKMN